ncbi:MAG: DUF620 domain-containing protein [Phycisphaeraceae bacterium]|nr:DUF620 domain-containing protein [Phycisphaeraceae bacterium]
MRQKLVVLSLLAPVLNLAPCFASLEPPAPADTPAPAAPQAESLPDAKAIMEKYLDALGGVDRLKKIKSRQITMNLEMPAQGLKGVVHLYQMPPAMAYSETEIAQIGKILQGSDGDTVWESNVMMGTRILKGAERAAFLRGMRFNADYDYEDLFKSMKTVGVENIAGRPAYAVEVVNQDDTKETRLFDKESGLLVGLRTTTTSQMGEIKSETVFSDYRDVQGTKVPFKFVVKAMQTEMVTTIEKIELDAPIPAARFDLPDDVKALLANQETKPAADSKNPQAPDEMK